MDGAAGLNQKSIALGEIFMKHYLAISPELGDVAIDKLMAGWPAKELKSHDVSRETF